MLRDVGIIPIETPSVMRRLLDAIIRKSCTIEQINYEDDTDLATLANGSSYVFSHSEAARYRLIVQIYEGANRDLVISGYSVQLTSSTTTTITNSSGSDWTNVYINILLY